jgi:outer membrane protein assembly factor BamB
VYSAVASESDRTPAWIFPPPDEESSGPFVASPSLTGRDGDEHRIYIGSTDGNLFVLRASDGNRVSTEIGEGIVFVVGPVGITSTAMVGVLEDKDGVQTDAVVVGSGDGRLIGVDEDGLILSQVWPFISDSFIRSSPTMTTDGLLVTATLSSGLFGVCPNGVGRYALTTGAIESSPAVGRDPDEDLDRTFYVGANDRRLRAVRSDGVLRWTFSASAPILSSPVVQLTADGTGTAAIYVADVSGLISKVDDDGRPATDFGFVRGSIGRTESSPALAAHPSQGLRLYIGSDDGSLHAIDAATGGVIWSFETGGAVRSSPAVVLNAEAPSDPIVIVGSFDGTLYYVRDTGDEPMLVATFDVPEDPNDPDAERAIESSPAVDQDGTVYFGSDNGRLYAVR